MRGRGLFCRKVPSLALPPEKTMWMGSFWGRGGFSERSPSPPRPLSPEERLAFELVASSEVVPPESGMRSSISLRESAAALSAAVTTPQKQENAPTLHGRTSPKEKPSLYPAALRERGSGGEALLSEKRPLPQNLPTVNLFGREREGVGFSQRSPFLAYLVCQRRQVAAALSAAVTTPPKQENASTLHGRTSLKEKLSLFPAALRERGSGGEALLSEKRPLPQNLPTVNLFGREREGGGFSIREAPSLANSLTLRYLS